MAMTQEKGQQNARFLLFADFSVPPEKALLYINDMAQNPHKIPKYNHLLMQNLAKQEVIKEKSREELKTMAKERVREGGRLEQGCWFCLHTGICDDEQTMGYPN